VSYPGRPVRRPRGLSRERSEPIVAQESAEGIVGGQSGKASEAPQRRKLGQRIGRAAKPPSKARTDTGGVDVGRWAEKVVHRLATLRQEPYSRNHTTADKTSPAKGRVTEPPWYVSRKPGGVGGGSPRGPSLSRLVGAKLLVENGTRQGIRS